MPIMQGIRIQTNREQIYCAVVTPEAPAMKIDDECSSEIHFAYGPIIGSWAAITVAGGIIKYKAIANEVSCIRIATENPNSIFTSNGIIKKNIELIGSDQ